MTWLGVAMAGALGAVCRHLVDTAVRARATGSFPWGILLANVTGSLLAGSVTGLVTRGLVPAGLSAVVAGGFLGAYTTFSTAMYDTVRLLEDRATALALANLLVPLLASVTAAGLGWLLVS